MNVESNKFEEFLKRNVEIPVKKKKDNKLIHENDLQFEENKFTYKPQISENSKKMATNEKPITQRQDEYKSKYEKNLQNLFEQNSQKYLEECSFKPKISHKIPKFPRKNSPRKETQNST